MVEPPIVDSISLIYKDTASTIMALAKDTDSRTQNNSSL